MCLGQMYKTDFEIMIFSLQIPPLVSKKIFN